MRLRGTAGTRVAAACTRQSGIQDPNLHAPVSPATLHCVALCVGAETSFLTAARYLAGEGATTSAPAQCQARARHTATQALPPPQCALLVALSWQPGCAPPHAGPGLQLCSTQHCQRCDGLEGHHCRGSRVPHCTQQTRPPPLFCKRREHCHSRRLRHLAGQALHFNDAHC